MMTNLFILADHRLASAYRESAAHLPQVRFVESPASAVGIIVDDFQRAMEFVDGGQHVLWSPTLSDATSCLAADDRDVARLTPALTWRFLPSHGEIYARLRAGNLGDPGLLRIHRWPPRDPMWADLDLALWWFSGVPEVTFGLQSEELLQTHLGFPDGGMAMIDHALEFTTCDGYHAVTLIGSTGAAYSDDHRNMQLLLTRAGTSALKVNESELARVNLLGAWMDSIAKASPAPVGLSDFKRALHVDAMLQASLAATEPHKHGKSS